MKTLRIVLRDQLSRHISSLKELDPKKDCVYLYEGRDQWSSPKHHKKKIAFLLSAQRHFAKALKNEGISVHYTSLEDPDHSHTFRAEVQKLVKKEGIEKICLTTPSEWEWEQEVREWEQAFNIPVEILEENHFLCEKKEFQQWAQGRKSLVMEYFYREMRKKYDILMEGHKPLGGKWNYDQENRNPPKKGLKVPKPFHYKPNGLSQRVLKIVEEYFPDHFGDLLPFYFAVTREEALEVLNHFIQERLELFGMYQDAMIENEAWMYHSHLSFYLNASLLHPMECIEKAVEAYNKKQAPLNSVEGFIRQIMGWREYVRGIYWLKMPQYKEQNFLDAKRPLPWFYWSGKTKMNCLKQCIQETKSNAYAHHIQRLMVLGNFALLAGINPKEVNKWYWIVYADAYEWVELPNVSGMILYADGGLLASKPYAASGAYINRMSNYCGSCHYNVKEKNGENACPFNYLYWDFMIRNQKKLDTNPRLVRSYQTLSRMTPEKKEAIKKDAQTFFNSLKTSND